MLAINSEDVGLEAIRDAVIRKWEGKEVSEQLELIYLWGAHEKRPHQVYLGVNIPNICLAKNFLTKKGLTVAYSNTGKGRYGVGLHQALRVGDGIATAIKVVNFIVYVVSGKILWNGEDNFREKVVAYEDTMDYKLLMNDPSVMRGLDPSILFHEGLISFQLRYEPMQRENEYIGTIQAKVKSSRGDNIYNVRLDLAINPSQAIMVTYNGSCECIGYRTHMAEGNHCKHINLLKMVANMPNIKRALNSGMEIAFTWDIERAKFVITSATTISSIAAQVLARNDINPAITIERIEATRYRFPDSMNSGRQITFKVLYRERRFDIKVLTLTTQAIEPDIIQDIEISPFPMPSETGVLSRIQYRESLTDWVIHRLAAGCEMPNPNVGATPNMMFRAVMPNLPRPNVVSFENNGITIPIPTPTGIVIDDIEDEDGNEDVFDDREPPQVDRDGDR